MKIGFETVLYGRLVEDWDEVLTEIREAGFQGVEIAQSPSMLRYSGIPDYKSLRQRITDHGLQLIGLAGGTLEERIRWVGDEPRPEFFHTDDWVEDVYTDYMKASYVLALIPHVFFPVSRMADARRLLRTHPELRFLPDTAHLFMAGDDPVKSIKEFKDQLIAVHVKDWQPQFGRYSHRYARGFVPLGQGRVNLSAVFSAISQLERQPNWLIAEINSTRTTTRHVACETYEFIRRHLPECIDTEDALQHHSPTTPHKQSKQSRRTISQPPRPQGKPSIHVISHQDQLRFREQISQASQRGSETFYSDASKAFADLIPSHLVQIWVYTPGEARLNLKGYDRAPDSPAWLGLTHIDCQRTSQASGLHGAVSSTVIADPVATRFNLAENTIRERFHDRRLLESLAYVRLPTLVSIPVTNTWNAHHLRFVVNVFPDMTQPKNMEWLGEPHSDAFLRELTLLSQVLGASADTMLDERCISASGLIQRDAPASGEPGEYYPFFTKIVGQTLDAEGVSLFLANDRFQRLQAAATWPQPLLWNTDLSDAEKYYFFDTDCERSTVRAWQEKDMLYMSNRDFAERATPLPRKSWEIVATLSEDDCIYAPITTQYGRVLGVVRCRNRREVLEVTEHGGFPPCGSFTDDEAAVLDAVIQAASPTLEMLSLHQERVWALGRLTHEFDAPIAVIRAAVDRIRHCFRRQDVRPMDFFSGRDYLEDLNQWALIQYRLLQGADAYRSSYEGALTPEKTETNWVKDVIAPIVTQMAYVFEREGVRHAPIQNHLRGLPDMWIDRNQFQQVFFNLLKNAQKYGGPPKDLRIELTCRIQRFDILLRFSNYGPGIDMRYKEDIFRPGFRNPESLHDHLPGQGLGLATVKAIVQAHGGTITLTRGRNPTTFEISLPRSLEDRPAPGFLRAE